MRPGGPRPCQHIASHLGGRTAIEPATVTAVGPTALPAAIGSGHRA